MDQTSEVVVIGGGIGGLATAALAAREGLPVRVIEKAGAFGGRAATQHQEGFSLNLGPHALYRGGRGLAVLRSLGIEPRGGPAPTTGSFGFVGDRMHALPAGLASLLRTGLLGLPGKLGAARVLAGLSRIDLAPWHGQSVSAWLDATARSKDLRALLAALIRLSSYADDPDRQSAGSALEQLRSAVRHGVLYLDGGWITLVDELRRAAEAGGAHLVAGARAVAVERGADGRAEAVRLDDGRRIAAAAVVVAGSPAMASALLPTSAELARFARDAIPVRAACLDVGLDRLPSPHATFGLGIDRPLYVSVHSAAARLAPEGSALVQAARYGEGEGDAEAELSAVIERLQPGFRDHVVTRRFLPRLLVSNALVTAAQGGLAGRPDVRVPGWPNVFLAGDWVGSEGQLADASFASAARVADVLAEVGSRRKAA